jgi:predicted ATPase
MADAPHTIFISYAHADSPFVDRLEADLRTQGFDPWVDRQRLAGGQRWRRELQDAVERAQVLLIVLSPDAVASENVQIEYDYVLELGKVVIPIYYRQCDVPMELRAIQWIDFRQSYEQGLTALLQALHSQQERATPSTSTLESTSNQLAEPASHTVPGAVPNKPLSNLPAQLTPLIGRQQEIQAVCALLRQAELRLVTLTGMAGIGKTRLGLQVAAELSEQFPDGVFLVPLAPVSDQEQVVPAILQTLSISDISSQTRLDRLKAALKEKQLLLLLDNFEQVVDAAVVVADLLAACSRLKVLVTSRIMLHLRGEHEFVVPPLSVPNPKRLPALPGLLQHEAVALFIQGAQAVKPEFELTPANASAVASMCVQLDGLPLAIELAAARIKYFPPQALLTRLEQGLSVLSGGARDLPARQQTLRGAIAWSYDLLTPEEQHLFRRLSVFVDGCTLQAVEQVCTAASPLQTDILEELLSLVDKSLLRQEELTEGEARFGMLQVLREFGLERLAEAGETEATRQAHALYYLALAEQAEPHLRGAEQIRWFARLEQEHENLRAALLWLLERARMDERAEGGSQQAEQSLRLCAALYWFWYVRGYVREGYAFLEQALATSSGVAAPVCARALFAAADLAISTSDLERAERQGEESLALFQELGDKAGIAASFQLLGYLSRTKCHYARARSQLEGARALFQELGNPWMRGNCLTELARIDTTQGEYDRARMLLEESLGIYQALGDQQRIGWVLFLLAYALFLSQTDPERAVVLAEQSLALMREGGNLLFIHGPLTLLGELHLMQGKQEQARALFEESLLIAKEQGDAFSHAASLIGLAHVEAFQGDLAAARRLYQEGFALLREPGEKQWEWIAACLMGLAEVVAVHREPAEAARLWGTAEAIRETIGASIPPVFRADYEQAVAAARSQLSEEAFAAAWQEGRTMKLEQVIEDVTKRGDEVGKQ